MLSNEFEMNKFRGWLVMVVNVLDIHFFLKNLFFKKNNHILAFKINDTV